MKKTKLKELQDVVMKTVNSVDENDQETFFAGVTEIAKIQGIDEKHVMFDIARSIYKSVYWFVGDKNNA